MLLEGQLKVAQHLGIPVVDIDKSKAWYVDKLGFRIELEPVLETEEGSIRVAFLRLGDLVLELYQPVGKGHDEVARRGHGHIDHFAIAVNDIQGALQLAVARGAELDASTPDGPVFFAGFGTKGTWWVNLKGPGGERVELSQDLNVPGQPNGANLRGWAHLGIPVLDLEQTTDFYKQFGFRLRLEAALPERGGVIPIRMLDKDGFVLELYRPLDEDLSAIHARSDGYIDHIALDVLSIDKVFRELCTAGFAPLENAPVPLPFWERGVKYFNVRGPNGEKVEFNERVA